MFWKPSILSAYHRKRSNFQIGPSVPATVVVVFIKTFFGPENPDLSFQGPSVKRNCLHAMPCSRPPGPRGLTVAGGQEEANNLEQSSYRTKHDPRHQSLAKGSVSLKEVSPLHLETPWIVT
mgnify:FL=1